MRWFWILSSIGMGLFWGLLVGLITQSLATGIILFVVGFFATMMLWGLAVVSGEHNG